jgi:hypothetical protein
MADTISNDQLVALSKEADIKEAWWANPEGWMQKPDFKRKEQLAANAGNKVGKSMLANFKKSYQWRWWVLEGNFLRYYKDQNAAKASGSIDLSAATGVSVSVLYDAPHNALDVNTPERVYTVAADTREEMIKWAKVLTAVINDEYDAKPLENVNEEDAPRETETNGADAGEEFDVTFETKESLFMNLEGLSTYTIVVTGFLKRPDGTQGQAEASGKIEEDDYLIGVNDVSLEDKTFFDSVAEISGAEWPMRLKFRRTKESEGLVVRQKGWCLMKAPDSNQVREGGREGGREGWRVGWCVRGEVTVGLEVMM